MANKLYEENSVQNIANSIRKCIDTGKQYKIREMSSEIDTINKAYNPFLDKIGYSTSKCENSLEKPLKVAYKEGYLKQETTTGKNYIDVSNIYGSVQQGITTKINEDKSINISGTTTSDYANLINQTNTNIEIGTYTFSIQEKLNFDIRLRTYYEDNSYENRNISKNNLSVTFTTTKKITKYSIYIAGISSTQTINTNIYLQLEKGSTATTYEQYTGNKPSPNPEYPQEISVFEGVENLIEIEDGTYTSYGITAVIKDGIITLNGTATSNSFMRPRLKKAITLNGEYILSANNEQSVGSYATGTYSSIRFNTGSGDDTETDTILENKNATKLINKSITYSNLCIRTGSGITYTNFVIKPQLEKGDKASPYVPYKNDKYYNLYDVITTTSSPGYYNDNGDFVESGSTYHTNEYVKVKPSTKYICNGLKSVRDVYLSLYNVYFYDENKTFLGRSGVFANPTSSEPVSRNFTTPNNCVYVRFQVMVDYYKLYKNLIEIQEFDNQVPYHTNYAVIENEGINIADTRIDSSGTRNGITFTRNNDGTIKAVGTSTANAVYFLTQDTYTIEKGILKKGVTYFNASGCKYVIRTTTSKYIGIPIDTTYTPSEDISIGTMYLQIDSNMKIDTTLTPMLYIGTSKKDYEPYRETTYTRIPLNNNFLAKIGDVKDEIDFVSGELRKRINKVVLDGSESGWTKNDITGGIRAYLPLITYKKDNVAIIKSSHFTGISYNDRNNKTDETIYTNGSNIGISTKKFTNLDDFKNWLSINNVEVIYPIETPQTINLRESQIPMFNGTNILSLINDDENTFGITYFKE